MKLFLVEKTKGRIYKSELIIRALFDCELGHNEEGAPYTEDGYISISDTKNHWICALSDTPVGVDIEELSRTVKPNIVKRLHKDEQNYLSVLSEMSSEWKEEFLSVWVKKEAYMKLKGQGLKMGLSSFSVIDNPLTLSFRYKKSIIGIAGETDYSLVEVKYDAPFEKSCFEAAADLLDSRIYSEAELEKKLLEKTYDKEAVRETLEKLKEYGYIDDEHYAEVYAEKLSKEGKGVRRIESALTERGIARETAKRISTKYRESAPQNAMEIAQKIIKDNDLKEMDTKEREKLLAKVCRKLASSGYESSVIYGTIDKLRL